MPEVTLPQGTIHYRESGSGEPIVFVHGLLVNGLLWRKVTPQLERDFRCIVPDLPLGSHRKAMNPDADLTPTGLARLVADFLEALDLDNVTLVGNDTGGAICQMVATEHPERIGRLVLTPCDAFEHFPPKAFSYLVAGARLPGGLFALMQPMRIKAVRNSPLAFGWLMTEPPEPKVAASWAGPVMTDRAVRRDAVKVLRGVHKRYTLEAARKLASFDKPALIAWAPDDHFFKYEWAERLAATIPDARLERVEHSLTFVPEDQPERLAELIASFVREPRPAEPARAAG